MREAFEAAPEGSEWIFPSIRSQRKNLRTWLERAILRSSLIPWPRLWQNFRATRATELADQYPSHVAAAWLGHTERIADKHYRQTTGAQYEQAIREATGAMPGQSEKPAQNPAQYVQETRRTRMSARKRISASSAKHGGSRQYTTRRVGGARFELATSTV